MEDYRELQSAHPATTRHSPGTHAPAHPLDSSARPRRFWLRKAALLPVAIPGAIGLVRLAYQVTTPQTEGNGGIIVRSEVVSIWMHPAHFELAQHPSEAAACRSPQDYRRYVDERGLEKAWYVITANSFQINGETMVLSTIRWPYDMNEPYFSEFPAILAIAAGKPPTNPFTDFIKAKVRLIPSRLLHADPRAVIDELRMLEHLPAQGTTR